MSEQYNQQSVRYRADIDGLRALAIIPIIFFHFECSTFFGGGFVGVDIFFVISGYLITQVLLKALTNNSFSFTEFYERRMRRIFPAFFAMLTGALFIFSYLYAGSFFKNFIKTLLYSLGMISNFYFWRDGGYFSAVSHTKPLLHTWSLSIEEQFYIFFPLMLFLLYKKRKYLFPCILFFLTTSLLIASVGAFYKPNSVFYLPITRAWELLLGCAVALYQFNHGELKEKYIPYAGFIGIGLIVFSTIGYGYLNTESFPGLLALPPCIGTVLCIISGSNINAKPHYVQKVLQTKLLVTVGLLSYSLYLWHWPIYVAYKAYFFAQPIGIFDVFILCSLTLFFATLSYYIIEKPIRQKKILPSRIKLFSALAIYACVLAGCSFYLHNQGNIFFPQAVPILKSAQNAHEIKSQPCSQISQKSLFGKVKCFNTKELAPEILFLGDSHAGSLQEAYRSLLKENHVGGMVLIHESPLLTAFRNKHALTYNQKKQYDSDFKAFIKENKFKIAVIAMRYSYEILGPTSYEGYSQTSGRARAWLKDGSFESDPQSAFEKGLTDTIEFFKSQNIKVFIVKQIPEMPMDVPNSAVMMSRFSDWKDIEKAISYPVKLHLKRQEVPLKVLKNMETLGAILLDPMPYFCDDSLCYGVKDKTILYSDDDHISIAAGARLKPLFAPIFEKLEELGHD